MNNFKKKNKNKQTINKTNFYDREGFPSAAKTLVRPPTGLLLLGLLLGLPGLFWGF